MGTAVHRHSAPVVRSAQASGGPARLACCILGLAALTAPLASAAAGDTGSAVRQAQTRFEAGDLAGASTILDRAPVKGADTRELADLANLRGAIALRRKQYDKAKENFARAAARDPDLWAARFNAAEVSFRRGDYAEASRQFDALHEKTQGTGVSGERRLAQYKHLLAASLAGQEKPVQDYLAAHHSERTPPLEYYYLNAAQEQRSGHAQKAGQWLAQANTKYPAEKGGVYAESIQRLGWSTVDSGRLVAVVNDQRSSPAPTPDAPTAPTIKAAAPAATPAVAPAREKPTLVKSPDAGTPRKPDLPPAPKPDFRLDSATPDQPVFREQGPAALDVNGQMPPLVDARQPQTLVENAAEERTGLMAPAVLGKPSTGRRPKGTPSPSDSPAASPAASTADASPAPAGSAAPSPGPASSPSPAFVQKYEAAYVKYLEKDYPTAKTLLEEAETIQPGQKSASDLRDLLFKGYYESAYVSFRKGDYPTALEQLSNADGVKPNNPDSLNLRGLVFSRQRNYEQAESSFKKASQLDPTFYAAKFNYAELPFNYRNYTVARSRFEELFGQTDPAKQPVEAEITQFKVFLTLLLEGKIDSARTFMEHFKFTDATPARYFCQAALDFYGGNMEKAQGWVDSASKEFKPQLVSIFKESFYRIGWMMDVNGTPALAGRPVPPEASPAPAVASASASPSASPVAVLAMNSPVPAASATPAVAPSASPMIARTSVTPAPTVAASASPVPTATPAVAKASVTPAPTVAASIPPVAVPTATPAVAKASATPLAMPSATPTPAIARASVTPTPTAAPAVAVVSASPSATPALVAKASPTPVPAVAVVTPVPSVAGATPAVQQVSPTPESESTPAEEEASDEDSSQSERPIQILLIGLFLISSISCFIVVQRAKAQRQARLRARRNASAYRDHEETLEPEEAQTPR